MATVDDIEQLLREDEAALKAKRKRLRAFQAALTELRAATETARAAAVELVDASDVSRGDAVRVFGLTPGERNALFPTRRASATSERDQSGDASADAGHQPDEHEADAGQ